MTELCLKSKQVVFKNLAPLLKNVLPQGQDNDSYLSNMPYILK